MSELDASLPLTHRSGRQSPMSEEDWAPQLAWKFTTETSLDLQAYRRFWGDEYGWMALVPVAWKNFDNLGFAIQPPDRNDRGMASTYQAASYWSAPIHLLGLGMGWTDIGKGLRLWRENGYRLDYHPILDFIWRSYGKDIQALEVYFGVSNRMWIYESLRNMSDAELPEELPSPDRMRYLDLEEDYTHDESSMSTAYTKMLLSGGDALHLESHIKDSFDPDETLRDAPSVEQLGTTMTFLVTYENYAGWARNLSRQLEFEQFSDDGFRLDLEILVDIRGFGRLGRFMHNNESGRYFLYSDAHGAPSLQWEAHRWGIPS
jgi:hypothetical protein